MRSRIGLASLGLILAVAVAVAVAGCGTKASSMETGRWESQVSYWGLRHAEVPHARTIWRRVVRQQHVHVDAVVALLDAHRAPDTKPMSQACAAGPLLRIVIRGTFPAKPPAATYEDIYASRAGRICATTYRRAVPELKGIPASLLQCTFDVPDSG